MTCPRKMNFLICWDVLLVFLQGFLCWWPFALSIWWLVVFLETSHWPASSEISTVSTFACNTFLDGSERQDMSGHVRTLLNYIIKIRFDLCHGNCCGVHCSHWAMLECWVEHAGEHYEVLAPGSGFQQCWQQLSTPESRACCGMTQLMVRIGCRMLMDVLDGHSDTVGSFPLGTLHLVPLSTKFWGSSLSSRSPFPFWAASWPSATSADTWQSWSSQPSTWLVVHLPPWPPTLGLRAFLSSWLAFWCSQLLAQVGWSLTSAPSVLTSSTLQSKSRFGGRRHSSCTSTYVWVWALSLHLVF